MRQFAPHIILILVNLFYGINFIVAKEIMPVYVGPSAMIFIRVASTTLLFALTLPILFRTESNIKFRPDKRDFLRFFLCALTGVAANQLLFYEGLNFTTPINAALIFTSNPLLTLLMSMLILKQKATPIKWVGLILGGIAAMMLIVYSRGGADLSAQTQLGNLMVFVNALSYAIYLAIVKDLMHKYHPLVVIFWNFLIGLFLVFPFSYHQLRVIEWTNFPEHIWWGLAFTVLAITYFAYLGSILALKKLQPFQVSIYVYIQPIVASLLALYLGKDQITAPIIILGLMIFVGVYMVIKPSKAQQNKNE